MDKQRILWIDSAHKQAPLEDWLRAAYTVLHASTKQAALRVALETPPDLILLDVSIPDGLALLRQLSDWLDAPILVITAAQQLQQAAMERGAWDFITKPIDLAPVKAKIHTILSYLSRLHTRQRHSECLLNASQSGIYVNDTNTYELLFVNRTLARLLNKPQSIPCGQTCYAYIFDQTVPCSFCNMQKMDRETYLERDFIHPLTQKVYRLIGKLLRWGEADAHVEYILDITTAKHLEGEAQLATKQLRDIIDRVPGGVGIYEIQRDSIRQVYLNDGYYRLLGDKRENRLAFLDSNFLKAVHPDDRPLLEQSVDALLDGAREIDVTYRVLNGHQSYTWLRLVGTIVLQNNGTSLLYCSHSGMDAEKRAQMKLQHSQALLHAALQNAHISVWEYDLETNQVIQSMDIQETHSSPKIVENVPDSLIASGYIHPDSVPAFQSLYQQLRSSPQTIQQDVRVRTPDHLDYCWERITYIPVWDHNGEHVKSIGTSMDVTEQKNLEQSFQEIETLRAEAANGILLNITKDTVDVIYSDMEEIRGLNTGKMSDFFQESRLRIPDAGKRAEYDEIFKRERLLHAYTIGRMEQSVETLYNYANGEYRFLQIHIRLAKHPKSGDIIGYSYVLDVNEKCTIQAITDQIAAQKFSFILLLDINRNRATLISKPLGLVPAPPSLQPDYESTVQSFCDCHVLPSEREACKLQMGIATIRQRLQQSPSYSFRVSIYGARDNVELRQVTYTYLYEELGQVLITSEDVTGLVQKEQEENQKLSRILELAQQANAAKSDFLSRMSHDIRTPMNAVIGLADLGQDADSLEAAKEYLKKIEASGRYLLSIINDVLNLSKMERQTIVFHPVIVDLPLFIRETVDIVMPAATAQKVQLDIIQTGIENQYLKFDPTYVRQVAVNLLSNAIKFTPQGGRVALLLENSSRTATHVQNRMMVRDTGIGISEDFLQKVFLPFEQENSQDDIGRRGTGLGLPIVKNIVEQMGGTVTVESKKGQGSTFTVEWAMELADESPAQGNTALPSPSYENLNGARVLLAEDHPLNAEIVEKLLQKKGVTLHHVADGKQAVAQFSSSACGFYDAILMDIRMPCMDGLEATKAIRALARADAKTIPILAMTANAFEEDAEKSKKVGMDAHLTKPIEPEKLYQTLSLLLRTERTSKVCAD